MHSTDHEPRADETTENCRDCGNPFTPYEVAVPPTGETVLADRCHACADDDDAAEEPTADDRDAIEELKATARRKATEVLHECNVTGEVTYETMHAVVSVAYMRGHSDGMQETVDLARATFTQPDPRDFT